MKNLILIICCLLFLSCTKDPNLFPIPQILKEYGCFEKGSYWVYQNDETLVTDSIFITSVKYGHDSVYSDKKLRDIYEKIVVDFTNSQKSYNYRTELRGSNFSLYSYNTSTKDFTLCILLSAYQNNTILDSTRSYNILNKYSEYTLNNIVFNDVIITNASTRYYYTNNQPNDVFYNQYYLSKGNWIIKKIIHTNNDTETWSLVKKRTIQ